MTRANKNGGPIDPIYNSKPIPYIKGALSYELYSEIEKILFVDPPNNMEPANLSLGCKNRWIHLRDAVNCGTVTPIEAYDAIKLDYVPENLTIRESNYSHTLRLYV